MFSLFYAVRSFAHSLARSLSIFAPLNVHSSDIEVDEADVRQGKNLL